MDNHSFNNSACTTEPDENIFPLTPVSPGDELNTLNIGSDSNSTSTIMKAEPDALDDLLPSSTERDVNFSDKKTRGRQVKPCQVCGDKAHGHNFNAITCESCKAFFRRNALKSKYPKCMFKNCCSIDQHTRRFCSACRLVKCFEVGMRKNMILGEEEKQHRKQKVLENKQKKLKHSQSHSSETDEVQEVSATTVKTEPCIPQTNRPNNIIPSLTNSEIESVDWLYSPSKQLSSPVTSKRTLSAFEQGYIDLLRQVYFTTYGYDDGEHTLQQEGITMESLLNYLGMLIRKLIRFAKKLPDFTNLTQTTQVALLKGNMLDCIVWRSAQLWNIETNRWIHSNGVAIETGVLETFQGSKVREEHIEVITKAKRAVGDDLMIIALCCTMSLFSPYHLPEPDKQTCADISERFRVILRHYLESKHPWEISAQKYAEMISIECQLRTVTLEHGKYFLSCDPASVEPLLLEMFDLLPSSSSI